MSCKTLFSLLSIFPVILAATGNGGKSTEGVDPRSYRDIVGRDDAAVHSKAQLRAGYINLDPTGAPSAESAAIGGHMHLYSRRYMGIMAGVEGYFVKDLGSSLRDNPDFFDNDGDSFALLSQAYLDGKWGKTSLRIGRQSLDTPHADSDDIRMMPNYFSAALLTNRDIEGLTLRLAQIDRMAGWENTIDSSHFVPVEDILGATKDTKPRTYPEHDRVEDILGATKDTKGITMLSAVYESESGFTLQGWFYRIYDIADLGYFEFGYETMISDIALTIGLQYDRAVDCQSSLTGTVDSSTFGVSVEAAVGDTGLSLLAAYNREFGSTGAYGSLGGGPFFTSLEDQTIDAIGAKGYAWVTGVGYDLSAMGVKGVQAGLIYGRFKADTPGLYDSAETDIVIEYKSKGHIDTTIAYSSVEDKLTGRGSHEQIRILINYSF